MLQNGKFSKLMGDKRFVRIAVVVGIAAILLILLSSLVDLHPESQTDADAYGRRLEQKLLEIVTHIEGVGKTEIFLTMDNSGESVYLKNTDRKTVSIEPTVRGVVIVCDGADDPIVAARILEAVTKSLSITADKVCITR